MSEQTESHLIAVSNSQPIDWDVELDSFVVALERAYTSQGSVSNPVDIADYCPHPSHPRYALIVLEMIRVDMELAASQGRLPSMDYYRQRFGKLVEQNDVQEQLDREMARLKESSTSTISPTPTVFPEQGQVLCGFQIVGELGRGSFGRVYLAQELALANRRVVIKVSSQFPGEAELLSKLQHKNIVPVYSLHHHESLHVVCMPLLGTATLGGLLSAIEQAGQSPQNALALIDTIRNCASQTWPILHKALPSATETQSATDTNVATKQLSIDSIALEKLRNRFAGQSYAHGVLWIVSQLAEGLTHAHERNILHRDIKPANVLLADDGLPMLLDFNLAFDSSVATPNLFGGTPRYMSPEQLQEVLTNTPSSDVRSDIYSLGLIMFELLTGRSPFVDRQGVGGDVLTQMQQDRQVPPRIETNSSQGITSGIVAIVSKVLQPAPSRRYQTAQDLLFDIQAQLQHQPLRFAKGESIRERVHKWNHRHPRLSASSLVLVASSLILLGSLLSLIQHRRRADYLQAVQLIESTQTQLIDAQGLLAASALTREQVQAMLDTCNSALADLQALIPTGLSSQQVEQADGLKAQLLMLRARGTCSLAMRSIQPAACRDLLQQALIDLQAASKVAPEQASVNQFAQQAIERALQESNLVAMLRKLGTSLQLSKTILSAATDSMKARIAYEASNPQFWTNLATLQLAQGQKNAAHSTLLVAYELDDRVIWPQMLLGSMELDAHNYVVAKNIMDSVIRTEPNLTAARLNRALAQIGIGEFRAALSDLNAIEKAAAENTRIYFIRELCYRQLGQHDRAQLELEKGLLAEPADGLSWNARGEARLRLNPPDVEGALSDFRTATAVAPQLRNSYENMATVLSEYQKQPQEAVEALDAAIECDPNYALAWSGRSVLNARLGRVDAAIKDAQRALELDRAAIICYQIASTYALIRRDSADERLALKLLRETVSKNPALGELMSGDQDLIGIKDQQTIQQIIAAAKTLK